MRIPDCVVRGEFLLAAKEWMGPTKWKAYLVRRHVPEPWAEQHMRAALAWRQLPGTQPDGSDWSLGALLAAARPPLELVTAEVAEDAAD